MAAFVQAHRDRIGSLLVLLQFGLIGALVLLAWPRLWQAIPGWVCLVLLGLSAALGGWTLLHNRLGNFNIHPQPKVGGVLVTHGPYRWMRHPMYTTVLLGAAGLACLPGTVNAWLFWLALAGVLFAKSSLEEQWLRDHHPAYAVYCRQCKRFVPGLF